MKNYDLTIEELGKKRFLNFEKFCLKIRKSYFKSALSNLFLWKKTCVKRKEKKRKKEQKRRNKTDFWRLHVQFVYDRCTSGWQVTMQIQNNSLLSHYSYVVSVQYFEMKTIHVSKMACKWFLALVRSIIWIYGRYNTPLKWGMYSVLLDCFECTSFFARKHGIHKLKMHFKSQFKMP